MAQITTGIRSLLSSAYVYRLFQNVMGAQSTRSAFVRDYVRAGSHARVLDVGCGPADILEHLLPDIEYHGFDISKEYIATARVRHGQRGQFQAKPLEESDLDSLPPIDVVVATGLFHHLDDTTATRLVQLIYRVLKPGGRLVTLDGVFESGQNPVARWLISMDRGQYVRTGAEYEAIFATAFVSPRIRIWHRTWIPYTYCLTECIKSDSFAVSHE